MEISECMPLSGALHCARTVAVAGLGDRDLPDGLPRRGVIADFLQAAVPLARRNQTKLAVLSVGLDSRARVASQFGDEAAAELMRLASIRIKSSLAKWDIVARGDNDEFIIVLQAIGNDSDAGLAAIGLLEKLSRPFDLNGLLVNIVASVGISVFPADGDEVETLLRKADSARHHARETEGCGPLFFDAAMQNDLIARRALEHDLLRALENDELVLHYQPIFTLPQQRLAGVEALIRWNHPEHGLIGPEVFLPAAEDSGLMPRIGRWVITEACRQAAEWARQGRSLAVSVNISGRQIPEGIPVAWLRETLARFSIVPGTLTFDITEKTLLQDAPGLRQWLTELDEAQIRLALDDFGSSHASLSCLRHTGIRQIKIDISLVSVLQGDPHARALVRSIIDIGKNMGLQVIAEGVENAATLAALHALGCPSAQGFHLAPPLPAGQVPTGSGGLEMPALRAARLRGRDPAIACTLI